MAETKTTKKAATVKKAAVKKEAAPKATVKQSATLNTTQAAEMTKQKTAAVRNVVKVDMVDASGKTAGQLDLPGDLFAASINKPLMAQAVRVYLSNQRRGTVSTKTRGEVEGSTRKIYRQKGTGRARHGGIRAPIFVGGGLVFGPKPRDYSMTMPKKMRRLALASALTTKLQDKQITVMTGLEALEPKTKVMFGALKAHLQGKKPSVLVVVPTTDSPVRRAVRNIEGVTYLPANQLHTYAVLAAKQLIVMKDAVDQLKEQKGTN